jgi:hypothetical protein
MNSERSAGEKESQEDNDESAKKEKKKEILFIYADV